METILRFWRYDVKVLFEDYLSVRNLGLWKMLIGNIMEIFRGACGLWGISRFLCVAKPGLGDLKN